MSPMLLDRKPLSDPSSFSLALKLISPPSSLRGRRQRERLVHELSLDRHVAVRAGEGARDVLAILLQRQPHGRRAVRAALHRHRPLAGDVRRSVILVLRGDPRAEHRHDADRQHARRRSLSSISLSCCSPCVFMAWAPHVSDRVSPAPDLPEVRRPTASQLPRPQSRAQRSPRSRMSWLACIPPPTSSSDLPLQIAPVAHRERCA